MFQVIYEKIFNRYNNIENKQKYLKSLDYIFRDTKITDENSFDKSVNIKETNKKGIKKYYCCKIKIF